MSQDKLNELRKKYTEFIYESYKYEFAGDNLEIEFNLKILPDLEFKPKLVIRNIPSEFENNCDREVLDNLVFNLGLVEIPSYWKPTCSPLITINAGYLNSDQIEWWHDLLISGMGQFYYENNIDFSKDDFLKIEVNDKKINYKKVNINSNKILIPIGGGKDSVVTLSLLQELGSPGLLVIKPASPATNRVADIAKLETISVERIIDSRLNELNRTGFLNGHTPISAVFHFVSLLISYIFNYKYVAFSNEKSSEEESTIYLGKKINHQYSKTFEFENKFRKYNTKYISNIDVFSYLRPLHEIQISKLFSKEVEYLKDIRSCNVGQQKDTWCNNCPKCLSTYMLLFPFIDKSRIIDMFGEDLYDNKGLLNLLMDLIEDKRVKPFECVGTKEELRVSLYLAAKKYKQDLPFLLRESKSYWDKPDNEKLYIDLINSKGETNNIPVELFHILEEMFEYHVASV